MCKLLTDKAYKFTWTAIVEYSLCARQGASVGEKW